jgi:hypothetical protein
MVKAKEDTKEAIVLKSKGKITSKVPSKVNDQG